MVDRSEVSNRPVATRFGTVLLTVRSSTRIFVCDDPGNEFVVNRIRVSFTAELEARETGNGLGWDFTTYGTYTRRWDTGGVVTFNARKKVWSELRRVVAAWAEEHPGSLRLADRLNARATIERKREEIAKAEQALEAQRAELAALVAQAEADGIAAPQPAPPSIPAEYPSGRAARPGSAP